MKIYSFSAKQYIFNGQQTQYNLYKSNLHAKNIGNYIYRCTHACIVVLFFWVIYIDIKSNKNKKRNKIKNKKKGY